MMDWRSQWLSYFCHFVKVLQLKVFNMSKGHILEPHQYICIWAYPSQPPVLSSTQTTTSWIGLPCSSNGKESACNAGGPGLIPGSGRSSGEGNGSPLQYSCLENPMDRVAWRATVHKFTKSWTRLSNFHSLMRHPLIKLFSPFQLASNAWGPYNGQHWVLLMMLSVGH